MPVVSRFLADLWNKIKRDSSAPTVDISENDIVIFVGGPTGSGKSWFIREATKSDLVKVSKHQHPFTGKLQAIRCELTDEARKDPALQGVKSIVFVDTPSFLTGYDLPDARSEFDSWFDGIIYKPRHVGVIYMHRIETDPALEPIADHLKELYTVLRKPHPPQGLHIVMSYDSESAVISESKITQRTSDLRGQVDILRQSAGRWRPTVHQEYFQGKSEVAWRAVEELLRTDDGHF